MDDQNKNLILATALSALVILAWVTFFPPQKTAKPVVAPTTNSQTAGSTAGQTAQAPDAGVAKPAAPVTSAASQESRAAALSKTKRIKIETPRLSGSLSLLGGRIDDLSLNDYRVSLKPGAKKVTLFSPAGGPNPYYALYGWSPVGKMSFSDVPGADTLWRVQSGSVLTTQTPVDLVWDNGKGLIFHRKISVDKNYMFSIEQSVTNNTGSTVKLAPYGIIARQGNPKVSGYYILFEGVIGAADGTLSETRYKKVKKLDPLKAETGVGEITSVKSSGWIGFTDKYWMATLIPNNDQKFKEVTQFLPSSTTFQTDIRLPIINVAAGATQSVSTKLFAGAKVWSILKTYQNKLKIHQFVDSIDWGIYFFLTKPIFQVLHFLNGLFGNMGLAIIGLTILIKALMFPLAYKSYVSMARMKELQPEIAKLKERVGDDKQLLQKEMMKLYKAKKANPAAGCLPIILQIPIFFSLYKVIFVTIELYHAPFFGWIHDLSAPDPTSILNLFGLLPWAAPLPGSGTLGILSIGALPILMGVSMWMQQKLNPAPTDKTQAQIFAWMPVIFTFMLGRFASGLVLYWLTNNTITFTQQYLIMRSQGVKPDVFGNIKSTFRRKVKKKG